MDAATPRLAPVSRARSLVRAAAWHARVAGVDGTLERVREAVEARDDRRMLEQVRAGRDVCWEEADDEDEPLVTVRIATFRRSGLLLRHSLASALRQTYPRLEILVVADGTDDDTDAVMAQVTDPRVRYFNLPRQGKYPADPHRRWHVSGSEPMNAALMLARGAWVAPCDDDDELTDDHVEVLLDAAKRQRAEFVHSRAELETAPSKFEVIGGPDLEYGQVSHGAVLYSMGLNFIRYSYTCWKLPEVHDWNLFRRMRRAGVRVGYSDRVTYRHLLSDRLDAP